MQRGSPHRAEPTTPASEGCVMGEKGHRMHPQSLQRDVVSEGKWARSWAGENFLQHLDNASLYFEGIVQ